MVRCFYFVMVRKSLIRLWQQCNQNLKMKLQSIHLISGKVRTSKLKLRKVDGYWNYDKSEFDSVSALLDDDAKLDATWKIQYPLADFHAPSNFKSYEELKKRLDDVLSGTVTASAVSMMDEDIVETPQFKSEPEPSIPEVSQEEDDDTMSYFQKLAKE